ncbi:hypothetical protein CFK37_15880 [Virgibacillus phasianinus]|uniref:Spore coat protein n=2 Tax=Virgibacillus phasianinus TaxID=2017483 RepID=A0A220U5X3_9BACI|nr:hypothetical protein CFK37_15880 [Virgibacillus phasianinus]
MKKAKKFLLGTALAGTLIATASLGTYSWFTSETEAQGEMVNGELEINNNNDVETPIFSGEKFTPSQLQYGNWITIKNTGDLSSHLKATYSQSVDKASLAEYEVGYMAMKYTTKPDQDVYEQSEIKLANLFEGTTNERSFSKPGILNGVEIVSGVLTGKQANAMMKAGNKSGGFTIGDGAQGDQFWKLSQGQYIDIMFGIKLGEGAGNEYQGAQYNGIFNVKAKQTDEGSKYENE